MSFDFKNASKAELRQEMERIGEEMGDNLIFVRKELDYLPEILMAQEPVVAFISGMTQEKMRLVALTDRRLILLDTGAFWGVSYETIALKDIVSIVGNTAFLEGSVSIATIESTMVFQGISKTAVANFSEKVREMIETHQSGFSPVPPPQKAIRIMGQAIPADELYTKLEKLRELKESKVITQDEFEKEKKKLLR